MAGKTASPPKKFSTQILRRVPFYNTPIKFAPRPFCMATITLKPQGATRIGIGEAAEPARTIPFYTGEGDIP